MTDEDLARRVDAYAACWRAMDPAARLAALREVLAEDARYCDPTADLRGVEALAAHIEATAVARPGFVIERTTGIDRHHEHARFGWRMTLDGAPQLDGSIDAIRTDPETGLITEITGFFGPTRPMG